jgi:hypothetical protein
LPAAAIGARQRYAGGHNEKVSVQQIAAEVYASVQRARSLFAAHPTAATGSVDAFESAATSTAAAGRRAAALSGELAGKYSAFAEDTTQSLATAGQTEAALQARLRAAAAVTQSSAQRLDAITARTGALTHEAGTARTPAAQRAMIAALRAELAQARSVLTSTQQQAAAAAGQIRGLGYGSTHRPQRPGGLGDPPLDGPGADRPDPPHGKDPRYWVDVTKILHVPTGELAPDGYTQIGPGLWYPYDDNKLRVHPAPPPAKYPLDISDITAVTPGVLPPYDSTELTPGYYVPRPDPLHHPESSWGPPRMPIDVRDVIQVEPGELAPRDYVEYLPGWWAPRPPSTPR